MSQSSNDIPDSNSQNSQSDTDELQKPMKKLGRTEISQFVNLDNYFGNLYGI